MHLWFLSFFLFSYLFSAVADWMSTMLPHIANLECRSEIYCMRLAENTRYIKSTSAHHRTTFCQAMFSQLRHVSTIRKKLVKQQYLLHMSSQYGELRPTVSQDRFASFEHPSKFQGVSHLDFVTALTSLNRG